LSTSLRGILDTSTVVLPERIDDPRYLPPQHLIMAVTLAELSVGSLAESDPGERAIRQLRLQQAEADFDRLPLDGLNLRFVIHPAHDDLEAAVIRNS